MENIIGIVQLKFTSFGLPNLYKTRPTGQIITSIDLGEIIKVHWNNLSTQVTYEGFKYQIPYLTVKYGDNCFITSSLGSFNVLLNDEYFKS